MFTDRFIKLPVVFFGATADGEDDFNEAIVSSLRVNPFTIESYGEEEVSFKDNSGVEVNSKAVRIYCRNDEHLIMMPIDEFEKKLNEKF